MVGTYSLLDTQGRTAPQPQHIGTKVIGIPKPVVLLALSGGKRRAKLREIL